MASFLTEHFGTLHFSGSPRLICPLASNTVFLCASHAKLDISVWLINDLQCKPLHLCGHRKEVTALSLSHTDSPPLLCSAAEDYIIVWDLNAAQQYERQGQQIRGRTVSQLLGRPEYVCFSSDDAHVAVCTGKVINILDILTQKQLMTLEGHDGIVLCAAYCPHFTSTLVSASEDRTFKIWDLSNQSLIYQSTIISSSPFISIAMNPMQPTFAVGTSDGILRIFDLSDGSNFCCLHSADVAKVLSRADKELDAPIITTQAPVKICSRPVLHPPPTEATDPSSSESEAGYAIICLGYIQGRSTTVQTPTLPCPTFLNRDSSVVQEVLGEAPVIAVATSGALVLLDAFTMEFVSLASLQSPIEDQSGTQHTVDLAGNATFATGSDNQLFCIVSNLLCDQFNILRISAAENGSKNSNDELSVLSCAPLLEESPLRSQFNTKLKATPIKPFSAAKPAVMGGLSKKGKILDGQPVTFRSKVKSSGYTQAPRKAPMFQPQTLTKAKKSSDAKSLKSIASHEFPMESSAPSLQKATLDISSKSTAVHSVEFSPDGQRLACAAADYSAQVFKMPLNGKGLAFVCHNGSVSSAKWSHCSQMMITSSEDKTARLWHVANSTEPLLTFRGVNNSREEKTNLLFSKAVRSAHFYYMDQFIILSVGKSFHLYKYHLDPNKSDIKRYMNNNKYKLVQSFTLFEAQSISAFCAINTFHSYIALCAGTDKTLEVFDLNVAKSVRSIDCGHSKAVHCIRMNEGSNFSSQTPLAYDLFATSAASDGIRLWDLRSNRCVRRYEGHLNRAHSCGFSFSPCGRFIATGSEDRSAYIFDIRSSGHLHKLTGHSDTVSDVAFHPLHAELVTATLNGKLRLFADHL